MSDNMSVELMYDELKEQAASVFSEKEAQIIDKAFKIANECHQGQKRSSGEPYIIHPMEVVKILIYLRADVHTLMAGFLHDIFRHR